MPPTSETCSCGRVKYTPADLERWQREIAKHDSPMTFNPDWAKPICWTGRSHHCLMRKLPEDITND